ncbi:Cytochrome P450 monooxygenase CYP1 [Paramyrothecium foliicola]|nr:Cytochrome P450 monooxygenase CYP1 [Paramyrothecium foliicola]
MLDFAVKPFVRLQEQYSVMRGAMSTLRLSRWELAALTLRKFVFDVKSVLLDPESSWQELSPRNRILLIGLILLAAVLAVDRTRARARSLKRLGLPVLKPPKGVSSWDYKAMLDAGARLYPDRPYIISYAGYEYVVYPSSSFDEVKRLPPSKASAVQWFTEVMFQGWRFVGRDSSSLHKTLAVDLPRALSARVHQCQEEAQLACEAALGVDTEWKAFSLFSTMSGIVVSTNSVGLVGPKLGNSKEWQNSVQRFPMAVMISIFICHSVPRLLRPLVAAVALIPAKAMSWYMMNLVHPTASKDLNEYKESDAEQEKGSLLQKVSADQFPLAAWLLSRYPPEEKNLDQLKRDLILASFHSTPSISATLYSIVSELVVRPGLADELRAEISQVSIDGKLPQSQLGELKKMDSFMRETIRMNLFGYLILFRTLQQPLKLSVGPELPAGSFICVDGYHLTTSDTTWQDPASFDPMRFLKLRQKPGQQSRHQFTSLGSDSPTWGDGPQVCPGRVYAGHELKIILTTLLMNYEFELPHGAKKPSRSFMPNGSVAPDMWAKILVRKRQH